MINMIWYTSLFKEFIPSILLLMTDPNYRTWKMMHIKKSLRNNPATSCAFLSGTGQALPWKDRHKETTFCLSFNQKDPLQAKMWWRWAEREHREIQASNPGHGNPAELSVHFRRVRGYLYAKKSQKLGMAQGQGKKTHCKKSIPHIQHVKDICN